MDPAIHIEAACEADVPGIVSVIEANRADPSLFLRSEQDVRHHLSDFVVARSGPNLLGCAALHSYSPRLAEILSVAVLPERQGQGIGNHLVEECIRRAASLGIERMWLATLKSGYFARFGFQTISRWQLPASVLLAKLRQVFRQTPGRWLPALLGRQTYMELTRRSC